MLSMQDSGLFRNNQILPQESEIKNSNYSAPYYSIYVPLIVQFSQMHVRIEEQASSYNYSQHARKSLFPFAAHVGSDHRERRPKVRQITLGIFVRLCIVTVNRSKSNIIKLKGHLAAQQTICHPTKSCLRPG